MPEPAHSFGELLSPGAGTARRGGATAMVVISAAETTNEPASTRNGRAKPTTSISEPSGGPANWLAASWAAHSRPLAFSS